MHFIDALLKAFDLLTERLQQCIDTGLTGMGEGFAFFLKNPVSQILKFFRE